VVSRSGAGCVSWLDYYMMYLSLSSSEDEDEGDEEEGLCAGCVAEEAFAAECTCDGGWRGVRGKGGNERKPPIPVSPLKVKEDSALV
jgi:hypothetical protein